MDFQLTKEQQDIKKAARQFALGEFPDVARESDINQTVPLDVVKKAKELGLIGLFIPEEYEGTKEVEKMVIAREILGKI